MHAEADNQIGLFDDDEDFDDDPVVRRVVCASRTSAPKVQAPCSVFDLARRPVTVDLGQSGGRARVAGRVETRDGVTRFTGAAYPVRWTEEDEERERQRRARQKPPRPSRKAKTRGAKLLEMIGEADDGA